MAKCRACGIELRPGARFCDMCGAKVEKICPSCGEVLRDQAKFCDLCGKKLPLAQLVARPKAHGQVCAGRLHTVAMKTDGTVLAAGDNAYGQCDVDQWTDVVTIAAGKYHTVGVRSDGTVLAAGDNAYGQCEIDDWTDIVAVAAGDGHTVGLRTDGTVVAAGRDSTGKCALEDWKDIVAVAAGMDHSLGLRRDGTVVAKGEGLFGSCSVANWSNIAVIAAGHIHTIGVRQDGRVLEADGFAAPGVTDWQEIRSAPSIQWACVPTGRWWPRGTFSTASARRRSGRISSRWPPGSAIPLPCAGTGRCWLPEIMRPGSAT